MGKNFDDSRNARLHRDRTFTIGGETFTLRPGVRPEEFAEYADMSEDTPARESIEIMDRLILSMIEDLDAEERWKRIRSDTRNPITLEDLSDVSRWMLEEQTGRPTQQPSPSGDGRETTGTTSMGASPSPVPPGAHVISIPSS